MLFFTANHGRAAAAPISNTKVFDTCAEYRRREFHTCRGLPLPDHIECPHVKNQTRAFLPQDIDPVLVLFAGMGESIVRVEEVANRVKQGFSAPDASWFRGESIDYIRRTLLNPKAALYEFLNPDYILQVLDEHCSGKANRRLLIWSLLSFEWWCRSFLGVR